MAITVTSDLTAVTSADTTTTSGTFYRLNGVSSSNPVADSDAMVQGTGCIAWKTGTTVSPTDTGGHFNSTATFNATDKHLFAWVNVTTAGNMPVKASDGFDIGLTNTSTTSATAWSTTNYKRWRLDGKDTTPASVGWKCYVIDPSGAADLSAGTLTLTTLKNIGFLLRQGTAVGTSLNNLFADAIRIGTGLTAVAGAGTDTINLSSIFAVDSVTTNAWGILTQNAGIYYAAGKVTVGSAAQTNTCTFYDVDQVLVWRDYPVADTLYEFKLLGAAANKTAMTWESSVIRGQAGQVWNVTCDANSDFNAYGCSLANLKTAVLSSGSVLSATTISASGQIDTNGASITGCSFSNCTATSQLLVSPSDVSAISGCDFTKGAGTTHALEITGTATNITLNGLTFSGYAATNGSTGNEAIFVNIASGSMSITVGSGGNTPSIRTAGASVSVVSGATVTFTGLPVGTDIVILTAGTTTILQQVDQHTGTSFAWGYSGTPTVDVGFLKPGYVPFYLRNLALGTSDASIPVSLTADRNYV